MLTKADSNILKHLRAQNMEAVYLVSSLDRAALLCYLGQIKLWALVSFSVRWVEYLFRGSVS